MPDDTRSVRAGQAPGTWRDAFAALPLERPDGDAFALVAQRLAAQRADAHRADTRRATRWPRVVALAATLALAVALPLKLLSPTTPDASPIAGTSSPAAATDPLQSLYAESAQLETLLSVARDDRVSSAAAAEVAGELDRELDRIDRALMQPGLARGTQLALWQRRVDTLRSAVGFESTRRWLVAHGERYDGALARVD
jgi:hypothetical protein